MSSREDVSRPDLEIFLKQDDTEDGQCKVDIQAKNKKNIETKDYWDPFKERKNEHPTTDCDTLIHLLKACLGTGILAMPLAFRMGGLSLSIALTVFVSTICTHCSYTVVKCAHVLYLRTRVTTLNYAEVGEAAFANGPPWSRQFAKPARYTITAGLFIAFFGTCSVYAVIIAENFRQVYDIYADEPINQRLCISLLLIPLILLTYIPNLKYLAPVSLIANIFMGVGLGITFYYLTVPGKMLSPFDLPQVGELRNMPQFFSMTIFALTPVGIVLPLENNMKTPQHFIGICGVLNRGVAIITMIFILLGFLGYLRYPDITFATITLALPNKEIGAQSVKILVGIAVFCTYWLQYFICLEIVWNKVKDMSKMNKTLYEYIVRTILTTSTVLLAVAVPTIGPFLSLMGAFCFSTLGLIIPAFIEFVTFWDKGVGPGKWIFWKNSFIIIFGIFALLSGSYVSIIDIIHLYFPEEKISATTASTLTSNIFNGTLELNNTNI